MNTKCDEIECSDGESDDSDGQKIAISKTPKKRPRASSLLSSRRI